MTWYGFSVQYMSAIFILLCDTIFPAF
jgi:hypothetical protein